MRKVLPLSFYLRDTRTVAKELLGKKLVHIYKGQRLAGTIVETEAYLGPKDAAAHTFGGRRTPRNEVMWGEGGHAYVYFIYGMHYCINAVTKKAGTPEAVLIRALECTEGLETIEKLRGASVQRNWGNGPGKLCQALNITRALNGESFRGPTLFIENSDIILTQRAIVTTPRVGIDYAGSAAKWPLRYYIKGSLFISKK